MDPAGICEGGVKTDQLVFQEGASYTDTANLVMALTSGRTPRTTTGLTRSTSWAWDTTSPHTSLNLKTVMDFVPTSFSTPRTTLSVSTQELFGSTLPQPRRETLGRSQPHLP